MYKMIFEPFEDKFTENLNIIFLSVGMSLPNTYSLLKSNKSDQYFGHSFTTKILLALTHWNLSINTIKKDNLTFLGIPIHI